MNKERIRLLQKGEKSAVSDAPIVYWMSRDQRCNDNWALLHAQELAIQNKVPLVVVFCFVPSYLNATIRQYGFMLEGLKQVEKNLKDKNISFILSC